MKIIVQRENLVLWHLICFSVLLAFTACSDNKEEFQGYWLVQYQSGKRLVRKSYDYGFCC